MDERHMGIGHGGRAIDRHNPHLRDERRHRSSKTTTPGKHDMALTSSSQPQPQPAAKPCSSKQYHHKKSKTRTKPSHDQVYISPPSSTRYLLSETVLLEDAVTKFEPLPSSSLTVQTASPLLAAKSDEHPSFPPTTSSSATSTISTSTTNHQVVALRVSLHCKGCEGKVRKHISKMKGVTSFSIDFAMKKVTVVGDITPLGVLASISRVKNARFWPSLSSSSPLKSTCSYS